MKKQKFISYSQEDTKAFAQKFAKELKGGEVVCLLGEVGSGKTFFVTHVAKELGVNDNVISPSFVIMKIYKVKKHKAITRLSHYDLYRMENPDDMLDLAAEEFFGRKDTVCFIEWPTQAKRHMPKECITLKFSYGKKEMERIIEVK